MKLELRLRFVSKSYPSPCLHVHMDADKTPAKSRGKSIPKMTGTNIVAFDAVLFGPGAFIIDNGEVMFWIDCPHFN